jgi:PAS domain S-box-containing protein
MEDQPLPVQQARLMARADLAAQALAAAADAIVTVNTQGEITSWNPAAEVLLGHTVGQAIGQTLALLIPAEHRTRHIGAFRAAMESGQLAHAGRPARVEAMTGDGGRLTLAMSLGLLTDPDGAPAARAPGCPWWSWTISSVREPGLGKVPPSSLTGSPNSATA